MTNICANFFNQFRFDPLSRIIVTQADLGKVNFCVPMVVYLKGKVILRCTRRKATWWLRPIA